MKSKDQGNPILVPSGRRESANRSAARRGDVGEGSRLALLLIQFYSDSCELLSDHKSFYAIYKK